MQHSSDVLKQAVITGLEELKADNIQILDVDGIATFTDVIIIASGRSTKHVKAISEKVLELSASVGFYPLGIEGQQYAEWILLDLNDIVVNIMLPQTRDFYCLEKLWCGWNIITNE